MNKLKNVWLFLMVFSFFYELPLVNFSFDRLNPRMIDVVTLIGVALYGNKLGTCVNNIIYTKWKHIVYWFAFCSVLSCLVLLQGSNRLYSLLAALRYLEGLLLIKIVLVSDINKITILRALIFGLVFDSLYCIYQFGHPMQRELAPGVFVDVDVLTGPLSNSYFEISQLLPTASLFTLGLISSIKNNKLTSVLLNCLAVICTWPLLFTGSRTGLVLASFAFLFYLLIQGHRKFFALVLIICVSFSLISRINIESTELRTISRTFELEERGVDNFDARIDVGSHFVLNEYDNALALPVIGGGFNIAPVKGINRVDYGIHSMYLYPFEQSGIIGAILFLLFLATCVKSFWKKRKSSRIALSALAFILSMMITGIGAHNFWRGFSSGNVNTFIVLFFCLAYKFSNEFSNEFSNHP